LFFVDEQKKIQVKKKKLVVKKKIHIFVSVQKINRKNIQNLFFPS